MVTRGQTVDEVVDEGTVGVVSQGGLQGGDVDGCLKVVA